MDFNEFIAGVVSAEMGDGFPFEALKNQAVCARTYALERFNRTGVANGGQAYTATHGNKSTNATYNTNAIVFLFNNQVVPAYFSARCHGDFTLNSEDGLSNITTCIPGGLGVGTLGYARSRPCSGHVNCSQTTETCCVVTIGGRQQFIYGHGVGMCQRGAQQFAGRDGRDWQQIVQAYYTNIVLTNTPGFGVGDQIVTTTGLNVRNSACGPTVITNVPSGTTGRIVSGPQRPLCNLAAPDSYLTWWEVEYSNGARGWSVEDFLKKTGTPPTITQFYPIASAPGKTVLVSGTGFVAGATQVFFGGSNLVPAADVSVLSDSQISVQVPASSTGAANINGYLTVRVGSTFEATSQTLPQNVTHPEDPASTFPEFVLWGDVNRNGVFQTNDLSLARAYLLFQATPTASQQLAADVTPLNANGSRGNGQLSSVDFTFLRAVSFGQTSF
ncbi:MAG: hypothetical protein K1Y36_16805 [Blastocatellia bacterium]|nr:hypothetical protein [Blastocatellia bacterium]